MNALLIRGAEQSPDVPLERSTRRDLWESSIAETDHVPAPRGLLRTARSAGSAIVVGLFLVCSLAMSVLMLAAIVLWLFCGPACFA